jgi:class 3 adenylate cyclase
VGGYTPLMRAGVHTGRPQRIGSDWLGVDVNIAARVMGRATRGGLVVSNVTLEGISEEDFDSLGITVKRVRKQLFSAKVPGVPDDLTMYWVKTRRDLPGADAVDEEAPGA